MRHGYLILLSASGLLACSGKRLHVGDDGAGGGRAGSGGGQAGSPAGAAGSTAGAAGSTAGAAGSITPSGSGGTTGMGGAAQLSVDPSAATFADTLVEAVSAPRTFTVRNDGNGPATTATALATLAGTNAADFLITSDACGATLQPGASCQIAIAFAPKTRSGSRNASLAIGAASSAPAAVSLAGTALPSLGLLAGSIGSPGFVDGTGALARFGRPGGVAADGLGNLYVADGNTIRKIVIATAAVTTLAGTAYQDGSADGTGAAARFAAPSGVASDGAGNLYVADTTNHIIRKIAVATGVVTTIAGMPNQTGSADGSGMAARFNRPLGVASDGAGNLYVADSSNHAIRKVVVATGDVTTFAGAAGQPGYADGTGTAASFVTPSGVAADGAGNLYVADSANGGIRKIVIATRAVTTLPGTFEALTTVASDGAGNLYVTSSGSVQKVVIATGAVTTLAGAVGQFGTTDGTGTAARFGYPLSVASDGAGNVYVADNGNDTIRKVVVATGDVTTLAGAAGAGSVDGIGAAARFYTPQGIASDGAGNVYIADTGNDIIRQVVVGTRAVTTFAGTSGQAAWGDGTGAAAFFYNPANIASDGAGNIYVAEPSTLYVRKIVVATRAVTTIPNVAGSPSGIVSDGAGNIYVADGYWNTIKKVVIATGEVTMLPGEAGSFGHPEGIATDGAGNLYVADPFNYAVRKVVIATGALTTFAGVAEQRGSVDGTGDAARFNDPTGIASDGAGNLYVADGNTIRKIDIASAAVTTVIGSPDRTGVSLGALPASLNAARGVAVLPTGELAIVDTVENAVLIGHL